MPALKDKSSSAFSDFNNEMRMLSNDTPLILAGLDGHIKKTRNLPSDLKTLFPTLAKLIDTTEYGDLFNTLTKNGVTIARLNKDKISFMVISLCEGSLLRCIYASFSQKNFLSPDDYLLKLCSYKDYLDSFERLHYDTNNTLPFIKMLKSRISGTSSIIELSNTQNLVTEQKRVIIFDLMNMLGGFIKTSDFPLCASVDIKCQNKACAVSVSRDFIKLCVCVAGLVIKNSKFGDICIKMSQNGKKVYLELCTENSKNNKNSLYEESLLKAFAVHNTFCKISKDDGQYSILLELEALPETQMVINDAKAQQQDLFYDFSTTGLLDIFLTASDFVF